MRQVARAIDRMELSARESLPNSNTTGEGDGVILSPPDEQDRNIAAAEAGEGRRRRTHRVATHRAEQRTPKSVIAHLLPVARYPVGISLGVQEVIALTVRQ